MPKLKPCPFCGGKSYKSGIYQGINHKPMCIVQEMNLFTTKQAISAWNKRVNDDNGFFLKRKRVPHISTSC